MIPEFNFKKKTAFLKKKEIKNLITTSFANKSFRIAGVAATGIFVLGLTVLGVYGQETTKKKEQVEALVYTAGVTTQIDTTERALQEKINRVSASLSKHDDVATTALSLTSAAGVYVDGVSDEAVSDEAVNEEIAAEQASVAALEESSGQAVQEVVPAEPEKPQIVGFSNPGIANVEQYVNIRKEPNESAEICGKLGNHAACEILSETNGWYEVVTNGVQGYVKADFLITGDAAWQLADQLKIAYVKVITETLYVREAPNTESRIIELVSLDQKLNLLEIQDEWVKVQIDGKEGYLNKSYIAIEYTLPKGEAVETKKEEKKEEKTDKKNKKEKSKSSSSSKSSSTKEAKDCSSVIEYATQFVGNPYVYGGTSLTKGADCSGFTMSVYAKFGVYLPHSSSAQAGCGTSVSRSDIQPGDLIFYGSGGGINHVALYIGGGKIVHASTEKTGIKISNAFYRSPVAIRRVMR